jgi:hypothetical protein
MQVSVQITPPLTPLSPPPFVWRHSRKPNTPSTLASFSFGGDSPGGVRTRPPSQLHHGHGPFHHPAHRHPPPPQKIPHTISRSSSALSLLSLSTNNRNAVYIDEMIDIDSGADDYAAENDEDIRLQTRNEEGYHPSPLISPTTDGVHFNALRSSQVHLGIRTNTKRPTRPPPAPPLDAVGKGGLGGVGVIDEDVIQERHQFLEGDRGDNITGGVYSYHRPPPRPPQQRTQFKATDLEHRNSDFDADTDVNCNNEDDNEGEDDKPFMSRWSLTSSIGELPTFAGSGVVAAFAEGGGGLFGSRKRMSLGLGVDKSDKAKCIDEGKGKDYDEKEKIPKFAERLGPMEKEKEKNNKKRGRLVSFISRISSNMIPSPPPSVTSQNTTVTRSSY